MTHYYVRATAGQRVIKTEAATFDTIDAAQSYATRSFVANLRMESIDITSLKIDILMKADPMVEAWSPSCRARFHGKAVGWVWAYPPGD